jgi:isoamylase
VSAPETWRARDGSPLPLGAIWVAEQAAYNFALYSKHAESVVLLLYRRTMWQVRHAGVGTCSAP